ncbi:S9 family peptidase [Bradyrhizobium sp. AUGA SZCCT0431]|uniref:alpha/beta hydrolase family protein n=1 Tax=Bradyrhizobium sp. AUGA SZCCT0431 TaxID=2807674 RepID=UPI001BA9EEC9|nr:alpha/beta fold hydrolase [Bradyrhizobium sp. AUGA SZCCT0431]MBR1146648.1 alpha/beta fold hydrolase [Bradyrhizobium sp. AUGA SZCCT0431]
MLHSRLGWFALGALGAILVAYFLTRPSDRGQSRFFADQSYHFQTLRALTDIAADGADTSEVLETIRHIRSGDAQGWFSAWSDTADRVSVRAEKAMDQIAKGRALLRAHNYYRTAEFFLPPEDPKRPVSSAKNIRSFYAGLDALSVRYQRIKVPYSDGHHLDAVYYPGPENPSKKKPLIVLGGGFDSTLEELYFVLVKDAHEHGYDVLTYDGPGQGSVLRDQGLPFTHEWEKPVKAVVDAFLADHQRPEKMVLIGMSMGGYLAPRAAAFDDRFDGVVAYDVFFDGGAIAARYVPQIVVWLDEHGFNSIVDLMVRAKAALSPGFAWAASNGMWTTGTKRPLDTTKAMQKYSLAGVAQQIKGDVLILAGADDHFVPIGQVEQFERELTKARSVTTKIYDRASGGAEHCQLGAQTLWHADLFDWMQVKFGS